MLTARQSEQIPATVRVWLVGLLLTCCSTPALAQPAGVAVTGFRATPATDAREAWLVTAVEETLSRRMRYEPRIRVIPPVRLHLARKELQDPGQPLPDWSRVTQLLGATRTVTGTVGGHADATTLQIELRASADTQIASFGPAPLPAVLNEATDWLFVQRTGAPPADDIRKHWSRSAGGSSSPLEYYSKAVMATRDLSSSDAVFYLERALQYPNTPRNVALMLSEIQVRLGESARKQATARLRTMLHAARKTGDTLAELETELTLANAQLAANSHEAALQRQQRALALAVQRQDVYGEIAARNAVAETHLRREARPDPTLGEEARAAFRRTELTAAAEQLQQVLAILERIGDQVGQAPLTNKLALIYERLKREAEAGVMHERTLAQARAVGSRRTEATAQIFLGQWHRNQGNLPAARAAMEACLKLAPPESKSKVHIALADVLDESQQYGEATREYEAAYNLLAAGDDLINQMLCLERIALLLEKQGRTGEARERWQEALDIAEVLELPDVERLRQQVNK